MRSLLLSLRRVSVFAFILAAAAAFSAAEPSFTGQVRLFETDYDGLTSFYDLRDSEARHERLLRYLDEEEQRLDGVDFGALAQAEKIDYVLLKNYIQNERRSLGYALDDFNEIHDVVPFAGIILALEESKRTGAPLDPEFAAEEMKRLSEQVKKVRGRVERGLKKDDEEKKDEAADVAESGGEDATAPISVNAVLANRAAGTVNRLARNLNDWFRYYEGYDPSFGWWVKKNHETAEKDLRDYAKFLREKIAGYKEGEDDPLIGDPIGRDRLVTDLEYEMIAYTPEELIKIGEKEYEWCEREWLNASRELGFGEDWKRALEYVKNLYVPPGAQDELVREQADEAVDFLIARDLITIPELCRETWRIEMLSIEQQKFNPYEVYFPQAVGVSYPTYEMDHDSKLMSMRGNNIHFTRNVTPHELIPGHHLQLFMAERYNTHRRMFRTPFLIEGWALYWEMRFWDLGFPRGPEDRIGMLFWRTHRCARIIISLKFHLGEMTPDEMIDYLVNNVGHERDAAVSEVRRYIAGNYSPLYQCAYMIGGLQLMALHKDLVESGSMTEKQFHDAVLKENYIPVDMIRASLTGMELAKDYTTEWRFYGDL